MVDRYEIGERQTSACAAPTEWLRRLGLETRSGRPSAARRPHPQVTARMELPWTFSTFDYRSSARLLWEQCDGRLRDGQGRGTARAATVATRGRDRPRELAPRSSSTRSAGAGCWATRATSRRTRRSRAGSRCIPGAPRTSSRSGSTAATSPPATRGAFPPRDEVRVGVGRSTPASTSRSRPCAWRRISSAMRFATRGTGFRTGCPRRRGRRVLRRRLRRPLPPADGRGDPDRVLLRNRLRPRAARAWSGRSTREEALASYGAFSAATAGSSAWLLRVQHLVPGCRHGHSPPPSAP